MTHAKHWCSLLVVCSFVPSYLWYLARITSGGESAWAMALIPYLLYCGMKGEKPVNQAAATNKRNKKNLLTSLGILVYSLTWWFPCPALIKATIAILTLLNHFGKIQQWRFTLLSLHTLPLMASMQFFLGYPLRRLVTEASALGLRLGGLPIEAQGTGLSLHEQAVYVDPPCSGIKMLWAGIIVMALLTHLLRLSAKATGLLLLATVTTLITANVIRGSILFFPESHLVQWPDWTHEGVGLVVYTLSILLLTQLAQYLRKRLPTPYVHT